MFTRLLAMAAFAVMAMTVPRAQADDIRAFPSPEAAVDELHRAILKTLDIG